MPKPKKATTISAVDRRTGTRREIGTDMNPTSALWGTGPSAIGDDPSAIPERPSNSSVSSDPDPSESLPDPSSAVVTPTAGARGQRPPER